MTIDQFATKVSDFKRGYLSGKNVFLWCGSPDQIQSCIGSDLVEEINLLDLFIGNPASDTANLKDGLDHRLSESLRSMLENRPIRSIALIDGLEIGAFCKMDLNRIYSIHADDRRMTILCAEESEELRPTLPPNMSYDPIAVRSFYRQMIVNPENIVEGIQDGSDSD